MLKNHGLITVGTKAFHFSSKNRYIVKEIQLAYGMKTLNVIKVSVTRWLSHGAA